MVINNTGTRMLKDDDAQIVGSWTIVAPFTKAFKQFKLDWLTERSKDHVILDE